MQLFVRMLYSAFYFVPADQIPRLRRSKDVFKALDELDVDCSEDFAADTPELGPDDFTRLLRCQYSERVDFNAGLVKPSWTKEDDAGVWQLTEEGLLRLANLNDSAIADFAQRWREQQRDALRAKQRAQSIWRNARFVALTIGLVVACATSALVARAPFMLAVAGAFLVLMLIVGACVQRRTNRELAKEPARVVPDYDWAPRVRHLRDRLARVDASRDAVVYAWWN